MKSDNGARVNPAECGFTLIEALMSLLILTFGLLSAGQLIFVALTSASLVRSKESAALVAQNQLEALADLYRRAPESPELSQGCHAGDEVQILGRGNVLNRFGVSWKVSPVPDPRGGALRHARMIRVTVTPVASGGSANARGPLNKIVNVSAIFFSDAP